MRMRDHLDEGGDVLFIESGQWTIRLDLGQPGLGSASQGLGCVVK